MINAIRYAIPVTLIAVGTTARVVRAIKAAKERRDMPDLVDNDDIRFANAKTVN